MIYNYLTGPFFSSENWNTSMLVSLLFHTIYLCYLTPHENGHEITYFQINVYCVSIYIFENMSTVYINLESRVSLLTCLGECHSVKAYINIQQKKNHIYWVTNV